MLPLSVKLVDDRVQRVRFTVKKYPTIYVVSKEALPILSCGFIINGRFGFGNTLFCSEGWLPFDEFWKDSRYDFVFVDVRRSDFRECEVEYLVDIRLQLCVIETVGERYGAFCPKTSLYGEMGWIKVSRLIEGDKLFCVERER